MRIKTIVDRAERELAAELLTRSSDKQRSLCCCQLHWEAHPKHLAHKIRELEGTKETVFALFANMSILELCFFFVPFRLNCSTAAPPGRTHKGMNAGSSKEERRKQAKHRGPASIGPVYFSKEVTFQPAVLREAKALHSHSASASAGLDFTFTSLRRSKHRRTGKLNYTQEHKDEG